MPSPKQVKYIEDLLIKAGFVDDLKPDECTFVINSLKTICDDRWEEQAKQQGDN